MAYDPNDPNADTELDPTSNSLFEAFTPHLQEGLLNYLKQKQAGPNIWDVAGKSLSTFSKNYMQALADPRTRGMAWGAGLAGVGDTLRDELSPEKSLQGTLQTAGILKELAAYRAKNGKGAGTSEYERLLEATKSDQYLKDPDFKARVDRRLSTFEHEGQTPQEKELQQMLDQSGWSDEQKIAYTRKWLENQASKTGGSQVTITDKRGELTPASVTKVQGEMVGYLDTMSDVKNTLENFDPTALQWSGSLKNGIAWFKDKMNVLKPEEREPYQSRVETLANIEGITSKIRHELFGAALTANEKASAEEQLPSDSDSPASALTKLQRSYTVAAAAYARRVNYINRHTVNGVIEQGLPLDAESIYNEMGSYTRFSEQAKAFAPSSRAAPTAPAGAASGAPPGPAPGPGGILPGAPPPPQGGLFAQPGVPQAPPQGPPGGVVTPPGPVPGAVPQPASTGPQAGPPGLPAGPPQPPPIAVQGGKLMAPKPASRAQAIAIAEAALKQGIPGDVVFKWQQENGF
jgi:hypothetical protein